METRVMKLSELLIRMYMYIDCCDSPPGHPFGFPSKFLLHGDKIFSSHKEKAA